jgi:hypothetical protein
MGPKHAIIRAIRYESADSIRAWERMLSTNR